MLCPIILNSNTIELTVLLTCSVLNLIKMSEEIGSVYFLVKTMLGAESKRKGRKSKNNTTSNYIFVRKSKNPIYSYKKRNK